MWCEVLRAPRPSTDGLRPQWRRPRCAPVAQLAVITPYAQFSLHYVCRSGASADAIRTRAADGGGGGSRSDFSFVWKRRSAQVPRPPAEVRHHPSSVNDLLVRSLMDAANARKPKAAAAAATTGGGATLLSFLSTSFSCIDRPLAARLIAELGPGFEAATDVATLDAKAVHQVRGEALSRHGANCEGRLARCCWAARSAAAVR